MFGTLCASQSGGMGVCQILLAKPCLLCSLLLEEAVTPLAQGRINLEFSCQCFSDAFHNVPGLLMSFLVDLP